jgi:hypothetical protein
MSANRLLAAVALAGAAVSLNACGHAREAFGLAKVTPDEFRVVTKAPLTLPPDYDLRPPAPGEPRPQELQPESAARIAMVGQAQNATRSDGEKLLVKMAGADKADPLARYVVDDEFGAIAYKDKTFADKVMFWRKGESAALSNAVSATNPEPLAAAAEAQRLKALTGGKVIVIKKRQDGKTKLPGL